MSPFQRFLDEQRDAVWRYLLAAVGREAADDCFQETFLAALRAYPRLRAGSDQRAWVLTIAHNKAMDHHRARARRAVPVEEVPEVAVTDPEPADEAAWRRVRALPARQRAVLTLRYGADLSHAEVARALGCTEAAARRAASDGLRALREELVQR